MHVVIGWTINWTSSHQVAFNEQNLKCISVIYTTCKYIPQQKVEAIGLTRIY